MKSKEEEHAELKKKKEKAEEAEELRKMLEKEKLSCEPDLKECATEIQVDIYVKHLHSKCTAIPA